MNTLFLLAAGALVVFLAVRSLRILAREHHERTEPVEWDGLPMRARLQVARGLVSYYASYPLNAAMALFGAFMVVACLIRLVTGGS